MDSDGLAASRPVKIQLEPIEDKQPSIYLRGGENDRYVLEDTSIELEVEAADDFGLREMGVEWQGEKSFYDGNEDENGLQTGRQTRLFGTHDYFRPFQVRARPDDSQ